MSNNPNSNEKFVSLRRGTRIPRRRIARKRAAVSLQRMNDDQHLKGVNDPFHTNRNRDYLFELERIIFLVAISDVHGDNRKSLDGGRNAGLHPVQRDHK